MSEPLKLYVTEKIESVQKLTNVAEDSLHAAVEIGKTTNHHKNGDVFRAEVNFHVAHTLIRAVAVRDDMYAAIDEMRDELARELTSHKNKDRTLMRKGASAIKGMLKGASDFVRRKK